MAESTARTAVAGRITRLPATAAAWLASAPVSTCLAALVLVAGVLRGVTEPSWLDTLAASPAQPHRAWTLVSSVLWTRHVFSAVGTALVVATVGAHVERFLGRRRYLAVGLASSMVGILGMQALYPLVVALDAAWGKHLGDSLAGGPLGLVFGALAAAAVRMDALWRRRVLTLLFVWLVALVAFGGGADDLAQLAASLTGYGIGLVAWRREAPQRSLVGTRHDSRTIMALVVVAVTAGTLLSAWSTSPVGPLSAAGSGLQPTLVDPATINGVCQDPDFTAECAQATYEARSRGVGAAVLAAMPLLLQLVLADGLRFGRRAAAIGTIVLQCVTAVIAALHVLIARWIVQGGDDLDFAAALGFDTHGVPSARLIVPLVVPLVLAVQVALNLRSFSVRATPGTYRRFWLRVGVAVLVGFVVVELVGLLINDHFAPTATAPLLVADYVVRLLPSALLALLTPTAEPVSAVANALVEWVPVTLWAVAGVLVAKALRAGPLTGSGERELLAGVVEGSGAGTLGWMLTWPGNDVWLARDGRGGVAYRSGSGVALTVTDPAAAPDDLRGTIVGFSTFATSHSLVPALYSVHAPVAQAARDLGWTTVRVAEEAVIDLPTLAFTGKAFQDVRTALNRATKEGIRVVWTTYPDAPPGQRDQIRAICEAWLGDKALPEMGFTLGGVAELDAATRVALAVDDEGTVHGVTSWLPVHEDGVVVGLTLDVMRRREGGFRSTMEFLIARALLDAKDEGLAFVSLSGSPLARSGQVDESADAAPRARVVAPRRRPGGARHAPGAGLRLPVAARLQGQVRAEVRAALPRRARHRGRPDGRAGHCAGLPARPRRRRRRPLRPAAGVP